MITVNVIAVGKLKETFLKQGIEEYKKRLCAFCNINFIEIKEEKLSDNPSDKEIYNALLKEGEFMEKYIEKSFSFAMCIEGKQLSSEELAKKISDISINGISTVNFFIGSSFGLCEKIKNSAGFKLSLSKMTFPHQLARLLLSEQIYRSFSILNNTRYHK